MSSDARAAAVAKLGFTERQSRFLVIVMVHSGVCLSRQYCQFARIVRGQKVYDFFSSLVTRRLATSYTTAHRRAHVYHVHGKALYRAIGQPNNRNRKPMTLARAVERLMALDAVLGEPSLHWLGTEQEKVEYFTRRTTLKESELPRLVFRRGSHVTIRYFPDKLPIGVTPDQRRHVFLYVVNRESPVDFRPFLQRHAELLRGLPEWEVRLLVPSHLQKSAWQFESAVAQELASPLHLRAAGELAWFFRQRRGVDAGDKPVDATRFEQAAREFHAPRYRALYRLWKKEDDRVIHATVSRILDDALGRGNGRVARVDLARPYQHLASLVGSA